LLKINIENKPGGGNGQYHQSKRRREKRKENGALKWRKWRLAGESEELAEMAGGIRRRRATSSHQRISLKSGVIS